MNQFGSEDETCPIVFWRFRHRTVATLLNRQLVNLVSRRYQAHCDPDAIVKFLDLNDFSVPIYSIDLERDSGIPPAADSFYQKIGEADGLIISFAEHNGTVAAVWKNLFDWMSRIDMKVWARQASIAHGGNTGIKGGRRRPGLRRPSGFFWRSRSSDSRNWTMA